MRNGWNQSSERRRSLHTNLEESSCYYSFTRRAGSWATLGAGVDGRAPMQRWVLMCCVHIYT